MFMSDEDNLSLCLNGSVNSLRKLNINEIAALCKSTGEPVYLTKNGEDDLVVMDIEAFTLREKMLKFREMN